MIGIKKDYSMKIVFLDAKTIGEDIDLSKFDGFYYLGLARNLHLTLNMMGKYLGAQAKVINKTLLSFEISSESSLSCMRQTSSGSLV